MGIRNSQMDITDDLRVHCMCDNEGPKCLECQAADRIEELEAFIEAEGRCLSVPASDSASEGHDHG